MPVILPLRFAHDRRQRFDVGPYSRHMSHFGAIFANLTAKEWPCKWPLVAWLAQLALTEHLNTIGYKLVQ